MTEGTGAGAGSVELLQVTKRYRAGDYPAVDDLSLTVRPGEVLALLGPSGSGKTTALRLVAGFLAPDAGEIRLNGRPVAGPGHSVPPDKRGMGVVFQDYALFPHLNVYDNAAFGLNRRGREERERLVADALSLVGMKGYEERYPHELSGGQQQRVALARALAPQPVVLLLDEPFSSLDAGLRAAVREDVAGILKSSGTGALLVTHDQDEAMFLGDQVAIMNEGHCEQVGSPEDIYLRPRSRFVAGFMGRTDFLPGEAAPGGVQTELGFLEQPTGLPDGSPLEVAFRPDDVRLQPDSTSSALITMKHFEGTSFLYHVTLPSGQAVHSLQPHTRLLEAGTPVRLQVAAGHAIPCFDLNGRPALG